MIDRTTLEPSALLSPLAAAAPFTPRRDLPILGYAPFGESACVVRHEDVSGYTVRPYFLWGVRDAYAVEFWDDTMEPVFKVGHLGWVHPRKPVLPKDDVVVQLENGEMLAKMLVHRGAKEAVLQQHNPPKEMRIALSDVKAIHLIIGSLRMRS